MNIRKFFEYGILRGEESNSKRMCMPASEIIPNMRKGVIALVGPLSGFEDEPFFPSGRIVRHFYETCAHTQRKQDF